MVELMISGELLRWEGDMWILELIGCVCRKRIVSKVLNKCEIWLCKCIKEWWRLINMLEGHSMLELILVRLMTEVIGKSSCWLFDMVKDWFDDNLRNDNWNEVGLVINIGYGWLRIKVIDD